MKIKGSELLKFMQNKISKEDYEELQLWIISIGRSRFGILKPKFHIEVDDDSYTIQYVSTGTYLGEGWTQTRTYMKIGIRINY